MWHVLRIVFGIAVAKTHGDIVATFNSTYVKGELFMSINKRTWVVIANGGHAEVMEYRGPNEDLATVPNGSFEQPNLPTREIMSDDRGRGFAGKGISDARGAMEWHTDAHEYEEFRFVSQVSGFLDSHVNDFDQLVVAAAPKALGTLRKKLSGNVQKKVRAELNKDFTNVPLHEVQGQLFEVIRTSTPPQ